MSLDQEICLCFHVSRRKILSYLRIEQPRRASQLSECGGAGTGCGWCRPYLQRLFDAAQPAQNPDGANPPATIPDPDAYSAGRQQHIRDGKGTPP